MFVVVRGGRFSPSQNLLLTRRDGRIAARAQCGNFVGKVAVEFREVDFPEQFDFSFVCCAICFLGKLRLEISPRF